MLHSNEYQITKNKNQIKKEWEKTIYTYIKLTILFFPTFTQTTISVQKLIYAYIVYIKSV